MVKKKFISILSAAQGAMTVGECTRHNISAQSY